MFAIDFYRIMFTPLGPVESDGYQGSDTTGSGNALCVLVSLLHESV